MRPLDVVVRPRVQPAHDAVLPHSAAFSDSSCQFLALSTNVHAGRTQAVCTSRRGPACCEALQEHRSRGCRARNSFCRWSWLPLWRPAAVIPRKKSSMWTNRSRSNRPTPASTTKTIGRATGAVAPRLALFLSAASPVAGLRPCGNGWFVSGAKRRYAEALETLFVRRFSCGNLPLLPSWHLPLLPPAPRPRPGLSRCPSPSSPRRPASTVPDFPERARRGNRLAPVPALCAPQHEVRPC